MAATGLLLILASAHSQLLHFGTQLLRLPPLDSTPTLSLPDFAEALREPFATRKTGTARIVEEFVEKLVNQLDAKGKNGAERRNGLHILA